MKHLRTRSTWLLAALCLLVAGPWSAVTADESATPVSATPAVDLEALFGGKTPTTLAELKAMQTRQRELSAKVRAVTVGVRVGQAQGSGVIINEEGIILTAAHVAGKPDEEALVIMPDGRQFLGRTLGMNRGIDAGMMKINNPDPEGNALKFAFAEMGDSASLQPGQWCLATGHPGGYEAGRAPVVRVGRILRNQESVLVTDCKLVGGDSGGPLFDMDGKVIGIHSRIGASLASNMHVPVKTYRDTWDRLAAGELWGATVSSPRVRGPVIGVRGVVDADEAIVDFVYPDMPAEEAGIEVGDVITRFNGNKVTNFESLKRLVSAARPGQRVEVQVRRGAAIVDLKLRVGRG